MIEQARAQLVDHPLADRDGDVVRHDVEQAEQRVQDDEADARGDEQLAARHRGNPRAHERRAAQHVVDHNFERPRLEHFGRGGEQHAGDRDRETAEMRAHPANRVTVEFQRGHQASSSARFAIEIPSEPATSRAQALMIAGMRPRATDREQALLRSRRMQRSDDCRAEARSPRPTKPAA